MKKVRGTTVALTLLMLLVSGLVLYSNAQAVNVVEITKNEYALKNLESGINSGNEGVRKSAIFMAGKYKITESVDLLVNRLDNEESPSIRLLIAYSLFEINSEKGMEAVKNLSLNDLDLKVKRVSSKIYSEYLNGVSSNTASL